MPTNQKELKREKAIDGIIVSWIWDEKGMITEVVIDTPDEKHFWIISSEKSRELIKYVRCSVEMVGDFQQIEGGGGPLSMLKHSG